VNKSVFVRRFEQLVEELGAVEATKRFERTEFSKGEYIDNEALLKWKVKAKNLLEQVAGAESQHFKYFADAESRSNFGTNFDRLKDLKAVFLAAKEDCEGGWLVSARSLARTSRGIRYRTRTGGGAICQVYDKNMQKRITALAGIRNSAAHGEGESLKREDVATMIGDVRRFLTDHPTK
jgi:hypothetical protein